MVNMRVDQLAGPGGDEESVRILLCNTGAKPQAFFSRHDVCFLSSFLFWYNARIVLIETRAFRRYQRYASRFRSVA